MHSALAVATSSLPSTVLRYAAAFFFVVVAIAIAYALVKAAKALERVDKVLADVAADFAACAAGLLGRRGQHVQSRQKHHESRSQSYFRFNGDSTAVFFYNVFQSDFDSKY